MKEIFCVKGRTFETRYFNTWGEALSFVLSLGKAVKYDGCVAIGTKKDDGWDYDYQSYEEE